MAPESFKVLLIESDASFARYVQEMLGQSRDLSAEVSWSQELLAGLNIARCNPFDVVLLDLNMPDGAGLGNIALLRAVAPSLPIIVGGDANDDIIGLEAAHAGAHDYLVKAQLTPAWLDRAIRYAIERHKMGVVVQEAEEKYHHLFDHLVEGIFQTTPEGRYLLANTALARIYGYDTPEDLMESVEDISRKVYVEEGRRAEFIRLMQEYDTITRFESPVYRKNGTIIWISENCRAIRDNTGKLLYYEGTVEDITQRRQVEESLSKSEALYHSLVETLPQNIFRKTPDGKFTFGNRQFCKTLGRSLEEIVGKTDFDFFPKELAEKYQKDDRRVLATGKPYDSVEEHRPPGGDRMFVQVVKTPVYDADGKPLGLQGIFWDITQQRLAEEEIRRVNTQLSISRQELREKNQQMEDDLKMAREIQLTMLPQQFPSFPRPGKASESAFTFTNQYLPTGSVGGDFFAISALSDREAAVFICDVAGHGVRSALVTAMVRALVEELKPSANNPGKFLTKLNSDLYAILKHTGTPMLTTAFYLVADWEAGNMRYANAGHPKPLHLLREAKKVSLLGNAEGKCQPALGLFEDAVYLTTEQKLTSGDVVILFTDGVYEVEDEREELYTQAMLVRDVQKRMQLPVAQLFDELLKEVRDFSAGGFTDDVCLVGMEYRGGKVR